VRAWLAGTALLLASQFVQADEIKAPCGAASDSPAVAASRVDLARDERSLEARLKLADALLAQMCYADAVHVLEDGESIHVRNPGIQSRLRDARSMLSEQRYFDNLGNAQEAAKMQRSMLRCKQLGDLVACDAALAARPDDAELLAAKGDALLKANRVIEALPVYRHAAALNPADAASRTRLANAEAQRASLLSQCETASGDTALQACLLALIPGASDEFTIQKRKAVVLQGMDKPPQALDAYIAASLLKSDDKAVALAIVALTDSTGRKDALALAARGNALLGLGRGTEALQTLQQAQRLSPQSPEIRLHLATAEKLAREEARRAAAAAAAKAQSQAEVADAAASSRAEAARKYSNEGPASRSH
jgi:tetratricopeptide (TPR) repeat protein